MAFLRQYVPFFDQYAQAISVWSPDSASFCYATADGRVMVQPVPPLQQVGEADEADEVDEDEAPMPSAEVLVEDGGSVPSADLALWSPC